MRNLLIFAVILSVITTSCKKVKCINGDTWVRFSADTIEPHHSLVKINTYVKGTDWSYPSKAEIMDIDFSSGSNIMMISTNISLYAHSMPK